MCNPPFYESADQISRARSAKDSRSKSHCTGSATEMITSGGEVGFVLRILAESAAPEMRGRVGWYTSLMGRKDDVPMVEEAIGKLEGIRYLVKTLKQGPTVRWVVAWTFVYLAPAVPKVTSTTKPLGQETLSDAAVTQATVWHKNSGLSDFTSKPDHGNEMKRRRVQ
ncbi:hypothetical protein HKX48_004844 [Thoreauomyces humboldtii]|nr:hypothetical protein HKX48_004844 [Thoreauomyces humboldtii]